MPLKLVISIIVTLLIGLLVGVNCDSPVSSISSHLTFSLDATSGVVSPSLTLSSGWSVESDVTRQYCLQTTGATGLDISATLGRSYTVLMWLKHASDAFEPYLLSTNVGSTQSWGVSNGYFQLNTNGLYSTPPQFLAAAHTGVDSDNRIGAGDGDSGNPAPPAYNTGEWHHVAASFNNNTATQVLYQQGVQTRSITYTGGEMVNWVGSDPLYLGKDGSYHPFKGCLDQVRVYNTVLTADQVKGIFLQAVL